MKPVKIRLTDGTWGIGCLEGYQGRKAIVYYYGYPYLFWADDVQEITPADAKEMLKTLFTEEELKKIGL